MKISEMIKDLQLIDNQDAEINGIGTYGGGRTAEYCIHTNKGDYDIGKTNLRVKFNACCIATYQGELELPKEIDHTNKKEVLNYILDHLNDVPCSELEYIGDAAEPVIEDDIYYIGK